MPLMGEPEGNEAMDLRTFSLGLFFTVGSQLYTNTWLRLVMKVTPALEKHCT